MSNYDDIQRVFEMVELARTREAKATGFPVALITDEEKQQAYRWADGNELRNIVDTPGFEIIMDKLNRYMDESIKSLLIGTVPTDKDAVLAKFAIAHASCEIFNRLKADIEADLAEAKEMPDLIKQGIRITKNVPIDATNLK